jgi:hypothetical protein
VSSKKLCEIKLHPRRVLERLSVRFKIGIAENVAAASETYRESFRACTAILYFLLQT